MLGEFSERVFSNRKLLFLLVIVNILGFLTGMSAYYPQLRETPAYLWLIVVDCPAAVFLFASICFLVYFRIRAPDVLAFFTSVYLMKYSVWTLLAITLYWPYYAGNEMLAISNFILHSGMFLEGVVLMPRIRPHKRSAGVVLSLLLINDCFDYFLGTHPVIPPEYAGFLMYESFLASFFFVFLVFVYQKISTGSKSSSKP